MDDDSLSVGRDGHAVPLLRLEEFLYLVGCGLGHPAPAACLVEAADVICGIDFGLEAVYGDGAVNFVDAEIEAAVTLQDLIFEAERKILIAGIG